MDNETKETKTLDVHTSELSKTNISLKNNLMKTTSRSGVSVDTSLPRQKIKVNKEQSRPAIARPQRIMSNMAKQSNSNRGGGKKEANYMTLDKILFNQSSKGSMNQTATETKLAGAYNTSYFGAKTEE